MTYLFVKAGQYVACQLTVGDEQVLTMTFSALRVERTERFPSGSSLSERWNEVRILLERDGWCGPLGG